ncbi:hypothetical protein [Actibacterium ureilyticum]|uniref:hypothetical protein n=1 Tax=Actibacterium ureilyticum TaxID=1590614 RepID=UPI000BAAF8AA|nr:hypothetical protein [Actibacterium ureilyticum]
MPNTLAHLGVNALATRGLLRGADLKWIWAGCVLPDLPWIGQRLARAVTPDTWAIDIRAYAIAQSSLFITLALAVSLALLSRAPWRTFQILALGALLHLFLDATQTKWANGVVLFAPFDWHLLNLGWYWPEDAMTWALSGLGAVYAIRAFIRERPVSAPRPARPGSAALVLLAYLALPLGFMPAVERADLHFVRTLAHPETRTGQLIEIDRNTLAADEHLSAWTGERLRLSGTLPAGPATVSVRGRFTSPDQIAVSSYHEHPPGLRDYLSYVGLLIVAGWWLWALWRGAIR